MCISVCLQHYIYNLKMMALLTADWKGLRDQPETLEQGRHSQKVLAEADQEADWLVSASEGEK